MAASDHYQPSFHMAVIHAHHSQTSAMVFRVLFHVSMCSPMLTCYGSVTHSVALGT